MGELSHPPEHAPRLLCLRLGDVRGRSSARVAITGRDARPSALAALLTDLIGTCLIPADHQLLGRSCGTKPEIFRAIQKSARAVSGR